MTPPARDVGRDIRRILVIRRKALGDALVTLPAVLQLTHIFPRARLDLIIDGPFVPLLERAGDRVKVIAWPPRGGASLWAWTSFLRRRGYDLVLDFLGSPRTALWTALSGAPLRVGYDLGLRGWAYNLKAPRNREGDYDLRQFAGESFLDPLRALGFFPGPWRTGGDLRPQPADLGTEYLEWVRRIWVAGTPTVGIMLSATWAAKAWPADHGAELMRLLRGRGLRPLLIPGPGDDEIQAAVQAADPEAEIAPATSLLELADLLSRVDMFVGTDCGARHVARAVGAPTVTLFGPTDHLGWNPEDPRHVAVRTGEPCSPCDLTECPVPGHPCLDGLAPETVCAAAVSLLERIAAGPGLATGEPKI